MTDSESSGSLSEEGLRVKTAVLPVSDTSSETLAASAAAALTPEEIVRILEQEFGVLGPEGEEKFVFQTDGAVVQDVVILVRSRFTCQRRRLDTTHTGCISCHHTPDRVSRVATRVRSQRVAHERHHQGWSRVGTPQRSTSQATRLARALTRFHEHLSVSARRGPNTTVAERNAYVI